MAHTTRTAKARPRGKAEVTTPVREKLPDGPVYYPVYWQGNFCGYIERHLYAGFVTFMPKGDEKWEDITNQSPWDDYFSKVVEELPKGAQLRDPPR